MRTNQNMPFTCNPLRKATHFIAITGALLLALSGCRSADNPLEDEELLSRLLGDLGFYDNPAIEFDTSSGRIRLASFRGCDTRPETFEPFFFAIGLVSFTPSLDVSDDGSYRYGIDKDVAWPPTDVDDPLGDFAAKSVSYQDGVATITLGSRTLDPRTITYDQWTDGTSDYALAEGDYAFVNALDATSTTHRFKLIAETNPASGGWRASVYKQSPSFIDPQDHCGVTDSVNAVSAEALEKMTDAHAEAQDMLYSEIREKLFSNYAKHGEVTQVHFEDTDRRLMLYTNPEYGLDSDASEAHCSGLDYLGLTEWRVPTKKELVSIFLGTDFDTLPKLNPASPSTNLRDSPDQFYWSNLFDGFDQHFDGGWQFHQLTSGKKTPYAVVYTSTVRQEHETITYLDFVSLQMFPQRRNSGFDNRLGDESIQLSSQRGDEMMDHVKRWRSSNALVTLCINADPDENEAFHDMADE